MKLFGACCFFVLIMVGASSPVAALHYYPRDGYLLLIFAPQSYDSGYRTQKFYLDKSGEELRSRNILVWDVIERELNVTEWDTRTESKRLHLNRSNQSVAEHFSIDTTKFRLLLIGKDGNVWLHLGRPVKALELFTLIDSLSQKREESKHKKKNSQI